MLMPEPDQTVVFHNAKFDLGVLNRTGLPEPAQWEDTLIAAHLLDETGEHGLKPLAKKHLGIDDPMTFEEADRMRLLDPEVFNEYARNDARYTFRLWPKFRREMERQGLMTVYELEKAVTPVVLAMEASGMKLDLAQMGEMRQTVQSETEAIEAEVYDHAGCRFDLHSPQKVGVILFDKLGAPSVKETNGGQRSVDREALEDVRGYHPAVDAILRYREIDKLASTFLSVPPTFADEAGRIHPEFKQLGAMSGRFSCSNPNVQQIPSRSDLGKKLRRMFVADEGTALVVADWSQMELRILAQYSKDPLLLSAYQSGTETDLHTLTATRMFGKAEADVTKPERAVAKMINFGIAYGITAVGLFNRLRPQGVDVTLEDCERFIADYFNAYAGVRKFLDKVEPRLRERGYVRNWFGRRRRVSGRTPREVRQAQNFIIQSTAADMAKTAMVRLHAALPEGARLIAMVHDEFIVECRQEQAEHVRALMVETMQAAPEGFQVSMEIEAHIADTWGDAK
ncbi:MAG: DNA polymerase [Blastocatellia bacterium]